jgi:V8-like Glu-specific endopeptidase
MRLALLLSSVGTLAAAAGCQTTGNGTPADLQTIYGADDRLEPFEVEDPNALEVLPSVGALIDTDDLFAMPDGNGTVLYLEDAKLCAGERFRADKRGAFCTAFMVSDRLALTAGHCIKDQGQCDKTALTFAFGKLEDGTAASRQGVTATSGNAGWALQPDEVYRCARIIDRFHGFKWESDYALIELDRGTARPPVKLATDVLTKATKIFSWGHPLGLPLKYARGEASGSNGVRFFHNMDLFAGNSGSPVFNAKGEAIGIVSSSMTLDVHWNEIGQCYDSHAEADASAYESATDLGALRTVLKPHL